MLHIFGFCDGNTPLPGKKFCSKFLFSKKREQRSKTIYQQLSYFYDLTAQLVPGVSSIVQLDDGWGWSPLNVQLDSQPRFLTLCSYNDSPTTCLFQIRSIHVEEGPLPDSSLQQLSGPPLFSRHLLDTWASESSREGQKNKEVKDLFLLLLLRACIGSLYGSHYQS